MLEKEQLDLERLKELRKQHETEELPTSVLDQQIKNLEKRQTKAVKEVEMDFFRLKHLIGDEKSLRFVLQLFLTYQKDPKKLKGLGKYVEILTKPIIIDKPFENSFIPKDGKYSLIYSEVQNFLIDEIVAEYEYYLSGLKIKQGILKYLKRLKLNKYSHFDEFKADLFDELGIIKLYGKLSLEHFTKDLGALSNKIITTRGKETRVIQRFIKEIKERAIFLDPLWYYDVGKNNFFTFCKEKLTAMYFRLMKEYFPKIPREKSKIDYDQIAFYVPERWHHFFSMPYMNILSRNLAWHWKWHAIGFQKITGKYSLGFIVGKASKLGWGMASSVVINIHPLVLYFGFTKRENGENWNSYVEHTLFHEIIHQVQIRHVMFQGFALYISDLFDGKFSKKKEIYSKELGHLQEFELLMKANNTDRAAILKFISKYFQDVWSAPSGINEEFKRIISQGKTNIGKSVQKSLERRDGFHSANFFKRVRTYKRRSESLKTEYKFMTKVIIPLMKKTAGEKVVDELMKDFESFVSFEKRFEKLHLIHDKKNQ